MKIPFAILLAFAGSPSVAQGVPPVARTVASPPADWSTLPELRFLRPLPAMAALSAFVQHEVAAGRCLTATRSASGMVIQVDMAVLIGAGGAVRRIVPRAIDCVTVEQYATGLVSRLARDNVDTAGVEADGWFHTALVFAWTV